MSIFIKAISNYSAAPAVYGKVIKETKCYITVEFKNYFANGNSLVKRLFKREDAMYDYDDSLTFYRVKNGPDWDQKIVDLKIWGLKHNDKNMFDRVNYFLNKGIEHMEYKDYLEFDCTCKAQYIYQEAAFLRDIN